MKEHEIVEVDCYDRMTMERMQTILDSLGREMFEKECQGSWATMPVVRQDSFSERLALRQISPCESENRSTRETFDG